MKIADFKKKCVSDGKKPEDYTFIDRLHMSKEERRALKRLLLINKTKNILLLIAMFIPNLVKKIASAIKNVSKI